MREHTLTIQTREPVEIQIITPRVSELLRDQKASSGICTLFTPHTTAALTINENADPDVPADLVRALEALVPKVRFDHSEGNSGAHFLSSLLGISIQIPYIDGQLRLGRWQGIYFVELDGPREREVHVYL